MKLAYTQSYPAQPQRVVELLHNEEFLADLAKHAGATSSSAEIQADQTLLTMQMPVPSHLTRFVGESIKLVQTFRFAAPDAGGVVRGRVDVDVPGMPVEIWAEAELKPAEGATLAQYEGDLKVKIPLVGKKAEGQIEPFIRDAFDGLERRATAWLSAG